MSTAFYEKLGFKRSSASNDSVSFFHMTGTVLGLFGRDCAGGRCGGSNPPARRHSRAWRWPRIWLRATRLIQPGTFAVQCGAKPVKKPHEVFWGGYSGYFADPDGHLWELAHNPFMPLGADGHMMLPD